MEAAINSILRTADGRLKPNVALITSKMKEYGIDIDMLGQDEVDQVFRCLLIAARSNHLPDVSHQQ